MFNRLLGGAGRVLITLGVVILLFVAFQLWGTGLEQSGHQDELGAEFGKRVLGERKADAAADDAEQAEDAVIQNLAKVDPATAAPTGPAREGDSIGVIEIPRIGVRQFFVEGVAKNDLKKGPGHYPGTPMPGQAGNAAIAGHRTTYGAPFNRIDELEPGDPIYVYTLQGKFRYEVLAPRPNTGIDNGAGWFSVKPTETWVIAATGDNRLTLTACHPKRSAAQRIVVQAQLAAEPAAAVTTTTAPGAPVVEDTTKALEQAEASLGGDASAKWPALVWGGAFAVVYALAWFAAARWRRWRWWIHPASVPLMALFLWFCFVYTDRWLPSI